MVDALNQELQIGSVVSVIGFYTRSLEVGIVTGFTSSKVEVAVDDFEELGLTPENISSFDINLLEKGLYFPKVISKINL